MGETNDYEELQRELEAKVREEAAAAVKTIEEMNKDREREFTEKTGDWFQRGCPFALKDTVMSDAGEEGKVIGLPVFNTPPHNHEYGKVWVHKLDGSREWINWNRLKQQRRSPRGKVKPAQSFPAAPVRSIQQKLNVVRRSRDDAGTPHAQCPTPNSAEAPAPMPNAANNSMTIP